MEHGTRMGFLLKNDAAQKNANGQWNSFFRAEKEKQKQ